MMGKYEPLARRLSTEIDAEWTVGFRELERLLGFPLPASARRYRPWWGNQKGAGHSQARGWQDAGWQVWKVDLEGEQVTFRRELGGPGDEVQGAELSEEALYRQAGSYLGTSNRAQIVREALQALCAREAARRLARMGGTMPDLELPPRRRFG
ncbi:MAG: hypothetical protein QOJ94_2298 [Sphingomonadales bacterium]|jgi:hypothetical protein|nr:hypothetical protein [Sphingomonadales bacterium]